MSLLKSALADVSFNLLLFLDLLLDLVRLFIPTKTIRRYIRRYNYHRWETKLRGTCQWCGYDLRVTPWTYPDGTGIDNMKSERKFGKRSLRKFCPECGKRTHAQVRSPYNPHPTYKDTVEDDLIDLTRECE